MSPARPIAQRISSARPCRSIETRYHQSATSAHLPSTSRTRSCRAYTSTAQRRAEYSNQSPRQAKISSSALYIISAAFIGIASWKLMVDSKEKKIFDAPRFTPFEIVGREEVSHTSIILTLRPKGIPQDAVDKMTPYKDSWQNGVWSVEMKQPELQIARRYTPLPPVEGTSKSDLRFLIRKEHKGEMSGYLHTLPIGAEIALRGPHEEYNVPNEAQKVLFLAGGTGIAPALQIAHTLLDRTDSYGRRPRIHILWANRRREDCEGGTSAIVPTSRSRKNRMVQDIEELQQKYSKSLSVEYLVDEEGSVLDPKKLSLLVQADTNDTSAGRLLLISGPEGFVNYFAGPKKWEGGKEDQGSLGGVLGRQGLKGWTVWKL